MTFFALEYTEHCKRIADKQADLIEAINKDRYKGKINENEIDKSSCVKLRLSL